MSYLNLSNILCCYILHVLAPVQIELDEISVVKEETSDGKSSVVLEKTSSIMFNNLGECY